MEKGLIANLNKSFEDSAYEQDGIEYWLARELQTLLGYSDWRNFTNAIEKAKESCKTSGEEVSDHFVDITKMVKIGSGAERPQEDLLLNRYACCLVPKNGEPKLLCFTNKKTTTSRKTNWSHKSSKFGQIWRHDKTENAEIPSTELNTYNRKILS